MDRERYPQHDEINLVRLVRRLEKSVANPDEWKPSSLLQGGEVWLTAQKSLQKVKFARRLVKNIEVNDFEPSPNRIKQLNDTKIKLDRVETFLKDIEQSSKPKSHRPDPLLPTLPVPEPPPISSDAQPSNIELLQDNRVGSLSPPPYTDSKEKSLSPGISTHGLVISPPEPDEISPTLITSALPSLLPSYPPETATTSSFARNFGTIPVPRKIGGTHGSTALQEELSSQLEVMAQQLKRNALHFSSSLEKDKAVVEGAQGKLEGNYDVMQKERLRLRDHRGKSSSTTWMVFGIIVLVLLLFMLMVAVIRFS
ncbi:hypothetical protein GALMADRAFT_1061786 [Galerina marginata CBS 339.88]|uniref:t-SNARE coiled-coil homology domain-containing protein n=1 Tax=Galerina marginata (strain CBS 339.88) TaxID=685588 RepID=A0A067SJ71_GALM3|nr:hypothetical protein GALMADRAFT_1061786 [Galerina marginata CBS 339.88]